MSKLLFEKPSDCWEKSTPIGNGFLGAMILGNPNHEIIYMNEDSLYSGPRINRLNKEASQHIDEIRDLLIENKITEAQQKTKRYLFSNSPHPRHYEPLGQVHIENLNEDNSDYNNYLKTLDLTSGVGSIEYSRNNIVEKREFFADYNNNLISYNIGSKKKNLSLEIYLMRRSPTSGQSESFLDNLIVEDGVILLSGYNGNKNDGLDFTMGLNIVECDGNVEICGTRIVIENASKLIVNITGRTSFRSENPKKWCKNNLSNAKKKSYEEIKENHIFDYKKLYDSSSLKLTQNKSEIKLPDILNKAKEGELDIELVQSYFDFAKYLLISSSRKGSLPSNLQGIRSKDFTPPWGSRYTININTEMNYWLPNKLGMHELNYPLFDFLLDNIDSSKFVAKNMYNCEGSVIHHNTDIFGDSAPSDFYMPATIWPMGGIWLAIHILEHFEYTNDINFLDKYFDVLSNNFKFIKSYLFEHNGKLNTGPSVSPENTYITKDGQSGQLCISPTMDIQIVREFLTAMKKLPRKFVNDSDLQEIDSIIKKLPETKINRSGKIMEWMEDYEEKEPGHRHVSHLFGLHPGHQISPYLDKEFSDAAKKTLDDRISNGGGHTGWSCAWIINFYARLGDPEKAFDNLLKLLKDSTLDNLFDDHPPFQIDGNFGGANGILEMLIQDYNNSVYILPALPLQFKKGSLKKLVLKSGCRINIHWEDGQVIKLELEGLRKNSVNFIGKNFTKKISFEKNEIIKII